MHNSTNFLISYYRSTRESSQPVSTVLSPSSWFYTCYSATWEFKIQPTFLPNSPKHKGVNSSSVRNLWSKGDCGVGVVSAKVGGIVNARSASQLPRNERQVTYIQSLKKTSSSGSDAMFEMINLVTVRGCL